MISRRPSAFFAILLLNFFFLMENAVIYQLIFSTVSSDAHFIFSAINFIYFIFFLYFIPSGLSISRAYGAHALTHLSFTLKYIFIFITLISVAVLMASYRPPPFWVDARLPLFQIGAWGVFPLLGILALQQFFIGIARMKIPLLINLWMLPIYFMSTYLGAHLGMLQGMMVAQVSSLFLHFIVLMVYSFLAEDIRACLLRMFQRKPVSTSKPLNKFTVIHTFLEGVVLVGLGWYLSRHIFMIDLKGAAPVSTNVFVFALIFMFSLLQFFSVQAAQAMGYKNSIVAKSFIKKVVYLSALNLLLIACLFRNAPYFPLSFEITHSSPLLTLGCLFLWIGGVLRFVGLLRGFLHQMEPAFSFIQGACFWLIAVPLIYALSILGGWGVLGLGIGFATHVLVSTVLLIKE